jgi:hypothetical protein
MGSAFTKAELYARWIGLCELSTINEYFDPYLGGTCRFVQTGMPALR